jgi:release factor glutamine methyltransferase
MILSAYLTRAVGTLKTAQVDNPQLDARLLAAYGLRLDRAGLLSEAARVLTASEIATLDALIARRVRREPVARIVGSREFWSLPFALNEATLEPRPDSETVIETVLARQASCRRILDLGTGSGCLLLALLHALPNATGCGIDISARAVEQAAANAQTLGLAPRVCVRVGDWLTGVDEVFDVIVSNPPYIQTAMIPDLMPEVSLYDPRRALDGGPDGYDPYRQIIPRLGHVLTPGGLAVFEVGVDQAHAVADLFRHVGFSAIRAHRDLGGVERCVSAFKPDTGSPHGG